DSFCAHPRSNARSSRTHLSATGKFGTISLVVPRTAPGCRLMPRGISARTLPLVPLLSAFRSERSPTARLPGSALTVAFLDTATTEELAGVLRAAVILPVSFHDEVLARKGAFVRHALNHLFRGTDPLPERLARCAT